MSGCPFLAGRPIVGHLMAMRRDPLLFHQAISNNNGDIFKLRLGLETFFVVNHPNLIDHVFTKNTSNYVKSHHYKRMNYLLGDGIFTATGEEWKRRRRLAQPAFQGDSLTAAFDAMKPAVQSFLARMSTASGSTISLSAEATRLSLDMVLRAFFGINDSSDAAVIASALAELMPELDRRIWAILPPAVRSLTPAARRAKAALKAINEALHRLIVRRLKDDEVRDNLLGLLVRAERDAGWSTESLKRLRDEAMVFLVAGHETTASTLTWAWYLLSLHPSIGRQLEASVVGAPGEGSEWAERIFQETMRLHPPGWLLTRSALKDDVLGGVRIPAGANLIVPIEL